MMQGNNNEINCLLKDSQTQDSINPHPNYESTKIKNYVSV